MGGGGGGAIAPSPNITTYSYYNCETIMKRSECATCTTFIASYNANTTLLSYMSKRSHNEKKDLPRSSINLNCLYF